MTFSCYLLFSKSSIVDICLGSKYRSDSIHPLDQFCVKIIKTSLFFSTAELSSTPGTTQKRKLTYLLLPFSINSTSFATTFHEWVRTSFSLYLFCCLSNITGYCLLFHVIFLVLPSCQHLFLYIIFICKNVTANGSLMHLIICRFSLKFSNFMK